MMNTVNIKKKASAVLILVIIGLAGLPNVVARVAMDSLSSAKRAYRLKLVNNKMTGSKVFAADFHRKVSGEANDGGGNELKEQEEQCKDVVCSELENKRSLFAKHGSTKRQHYLRRGKLEVMAMKRDLAFFFSCCGKAQQQQDPVTKTIQKKGMPIALPTEQIPTGNGAKDEDWVILDNNNDHQDSQNMIDASDSLDLSGSLGISPINQQGSEVMEPAQENTDNILDGLKDVYKESVKKQHGPIDAIDSLDFGLDDQHDELPEDPTPKNAIDQLI